MEVSRWTTKTAPRIFRSIGLNPFGLEMGAQADAEAPTNWALGTCAQVTVQKALAQSQRLVGAGLGPRCPPSPPSEPASQSRAPWRY